MVRIVVHGAKIRTGLKLAAVLIPAGLLMTSCQTMSKQECVAADWKAVGMNDGVAGYAPQDRFAARAKDCAKAGVVANQSLWQKGYEKGLETYCTPMGGLAAGQAGHSYAGVCSAKNAAGFLQGYQLGRSEHDTQQQISDIEGEISMAQLNLSSVQGQAAANQITAAQAAMQADAIRARLDSLMFESDDLRLQLSRIQHDIERFTESSGAR